MANRVLQVRETIKTLKKIIRDQSDADVRDRIRALMLAAKGSTDKQIAERLGYSLPWVQKWIRRYKEGGLEDLNDGARSGQPALLSDEQVLILYNEILAGPDPNGPLSRYRISDIRDLIKERFGVEFSLSGTHALMQRMKLSHIKPRPSHPKNDPQAMEDWKKKPKIFSPNKNVTERAKVFRSGSKTKLDLAKKEL